MPGDSSMTWVWADTVGDIQEAKNNIDWSSG